MPKCSVDGCESDAHYEVIFYDVYPHGEITVFYEPHSSCPYLCHEHLAENEIGAETGLQDGQLRRYRGIVSYPHTRSNGQGFCIYKPIT